MARQLRKRSDAVASLLRSLEDPGTCDKTGIERLDAAMGGGLYAGKAYGLQARKKVGKTILLGTISYNLNLSGVSHLWIAAEMNDRELEERHLSRALKRSSVDFLTRDDVLLSSEVRSYAEDMDDNIIYCNANGINLKELEDVIRTAVKEHGVRGFFLDYLQLVRGGGNVNRTDHLEAVAMLIAGLVRELQVWAFVAAQLNQEDNTRGGEGMLLAFDQVYTLRRHKTSASAWLEMSETRYTPYRNVGDEKQPGILLESLGPYFRSASVV